MEKANVLILTAGSIQADVASIFGDIPSGMIPINSKPAISWIIDELLSQGFNHYFIAVGHKSELIKSFVNRKYGGKCSIKFIEVDSQLGPGNSIINSLKHINTENLLIFLGDTLINKDIDLTENFVYISKDFEEPSRWCLVKTDANDYAKEFIDKEKIIRDASELQALIGVYYLKMSVLRSTAERMCTEEVIEISDILDIYKQYESIKCIVCDKWFDIGHLDKYHNSKIQLTQARNFNSLEYDNLISVITKKSVNREKFIDEIQWYLDIPKEISVLTPRIIDYSLDTELFLKLEYYGYPTVAELFLYGDLHPKIWERIISKLIDILFLFCKYERKVSYDSYDIMYLKKTLERIDELVVVDDEFRQLFLYDTVTINGEPCINFSGLLPFIKDEINFLYANSYGNNCIIHGDFCSSNILYDINSGVVRLIDPRGSWGESYYGDIRYDAAKLRHSFDGKYDFIVNDLFSVNQRENNFELSIFDNELHSEVGTILDRIISKKWDLDEIMLIEGLLFISMIPLHNDHKKRQLAMYCIGINLLNEVYSKKKLVVGETLR